MIANLYRRRDTKTLTVLQNTNSNAIRLYDKLLYFFILLYIGDDDFCPLSPFQIIPYNNVEQATTFSLDTQVHGCLLENAWAKFPHKGEEIELNSWISADCIDIISSRNKLHFKVSNLIHYL